MAYSPQLGHRIDLFISQYNSGDIGALPVFLGPGFHLVSVCHSEAVGNVRAAIDMVLVRPGANGGVAHDVLAPNKEARLIAWNKTSGVSYSDIVVFST